jgi:hypothetical protein
MSPRNKISPSPKTQKVLTPKQISWRAAKQKEVELWESGVRDTKREIYRLRLEEADIQGLDPTCRPMESLDLAEIRKKIDEKSRMLIFQQSYVDRLNTMPHRKKPSITGLALATPSIRFKESAISPEIDLEF